MGPKKLGNALLFPHIAIMITLVPVAAVLLVCSMVFLGTESVISIISYALAAYTLTVWCFKIPSLVQFFKTFKIEKTTFSDGSDDGNRPKMDDRRNRRRDFRSRPYKSNLYDHHRHQKT